MKTIDSKYPDFFSLVTLPFFLSFRFKIGLCLIHNIDFGSIFVYLGLKMGDFNCELLVD
jgi:hypothetical protein